MSEFNANDKDKNVNSLNVTCGDTNSLSNNKCLQKFSISIRRKQMLWFTRELKNHLELLDLPAYAVTDNSQVNQPRATLRQFIHWRNNTDMVIIFYNQLQ